MPCTPNVAVPITHARLCLCALRNTDARANGAALESAAVETRCIVAVGCIVTKGGVDVLGVQMPVRHCYGSCMVVELIVLKITNQRHV